MDGIHPRVSIEKPISLPDAVAANQVRSKYAKQEMASTVFVAMGCRNFIVGKVGCRAVSRKKERNSRSSSITTRKALILDVVDADGMKTRTAGNN